jgi:hypothetical protein
MQNVEETVQFVPLVRTLIKPANVQNQKLFAGDVFFFTDVVPVS